MREPTVSIEKIKSGKHFALIGNPCGSGDRREIKAECPDCREAFHLSEGDMHEAWARYDEWAKDDAYLRGIFDCPNGECERPFILSIFGEERAFVGAVGFYERENDRTLKAKRIRGESEGKVL